MGVSMGFERPEPHWLELVLVEEEAKGLRAAIPQLAGFSIGGAA